MYFFMAMILHILYGSSMYFVGGHAMCLFIWAWAWLPQGWYIYEDRSMFDYRYLTSSLCFDSFLISPHLHIFCKVFWTSSSLLTSHFRGDLLHFYFLPYKLGLTSSIIVDLDTIFFPSSSSSWETITPYIPIREGWKETISPCMTNREKYSPSLPNLKGVLVL